MTRNATAWIAFLFVAVVATTQAGMAIGGEARLRRHLEGKLMGNEAKATIKSIDDGEDFLVIKVDLRHRQRAKHTYKVAGHKVGSVDEIVYSNTVHRTFTIDRRKPDARLDLGMGRHTTAGEVEAAFNKPDKRH